MAGGVIAVIPARAGSKGIPHKNLSPIGDTTLLGKCIQTARGAACIHRVFVTTDGEDIAAEARLQGASVIRRPEDLSSDEATSESALLHALDDLQGQGLEPDTLVFLQCTSPFLQSDDVERAVKQVKDGVDCAFTVTQFHGFLWQEMEAPNPMGHDPRHRLRRQDISPMFRETGSVYAMSVEAFRKEGSRFCGKLAMIEVPEWRGLDIDSQDDLLVAQAIQNKTSLK